MNEELLLLAEANTAGEGFDDWSRQLELESIRYSRALPEGEEARVQ